MATPAGMPLCNLTEIEKALVHLQQALPVFEPLVGVGAAQSTDKGTLMVGGHWRDATSGTTPLPQDGSNGRFQGRFRFPHEFNLSDGLQLNVYWCARSPLHLEVRLEVLVRDPESLREVMGLLLELSPHLLPHGCSKNLNTPAAVPYVYSLMLCRVAFKTGLSMWAPLAPLIGELRFSRSRSRFLPKFYRWTKDSDGLGAVPSGLKYISLWRAPCLSARPLTRVYILAPCWEHSKHWPSRKWVYRT